MRGPCPRCGNDAGMEVAVCPRCGATSAPSALQGAPSAPAGDRSDVARWEKTIIDRKAVPDYQERARFAAGRGDFYRSVGEQDLTEPAARVRLPRPDRRTGGDEGDHTIMDRGGGPADDSDGDHTVFIRDGRIVNGGPLVYFVLRNGIRAGKVYLLGKNTSIGRTPDNDIPVGDETVSKHHARVVVEDGRYWFWDLASANHSYLRLADGTSKRIREPHELADGDTLDLGEVRMTYIEVDLGEVR